MNVQNELELTMFRSKNKVYDKDFKLSIRKRNQSDSSLRNHRPDKNFIRTIWFSEHDTNYPIVICSAVRSEMVLKENNNLVFERTL